MSVSANAAENSALPTLTVKAPCEALISVVVSLAEAIPLGADWSDGVFTSVDRGDTVGVVSAAGLVTGELDSAGTTGGEKRRS